ncbi:MAG: hypothetical protein AAF598_07565 [Bacteroidota bacterium]
MPSQNEQSGPIKRPSALLLSTEIGRALFDLGAHYTFLPLLHLAKAGDGHPVLVLPGFMASDTSTRITRKYLDRLGYQTYGWDLGRNYAREDYMEILDMRLRNIHAEHQSKVSIIGWSLGGVYARQVAKSYPDMVRQVITLGSPFAGVQEPNNAAWIYNRVLNRERASDINEELIKDIPLPAPVPTTAIYTKEDGVVPWQVCLEKEEDEWHQNIQVRGSHLGLGVNPSVLLLVADRLSQPANNWTRFTGRTRYENAVLYPSLAS